MREFCLKLLIVLIGEKHLLIQSILVANSFGRFVSDICVGNIERKEK